MLQMQGKSCSQKSKKESAVVPKRMTAFTPSSLFVESLVEQLCKLFEKDPISQKKLYELICQKLYEMKLIDKTYKVEEFQFMRTYYQKALYNLLTISNSPAIDCKLETFLNQSPSCLSLPPINSGIFDWSRYHNDFEEIQFIDSGGFGRVFRARNKVDGCEYAIKKICLRYSSGEQFLRSLSEVRTLAMLDHCNIVAYKAAWFEPLNSLVASEDCSSSSDSKASPDIEPSDEVLESSISDRKSRDELEDDSSNIVFENGIEDVFRNVPNTGASSNFSKEFKQFLLEGDRKDKQRPGGVASSYISREMLNRPEKNGILCDHSTGSDKQGCRGWKVPGTSIECAVLHIQMQLCKESLRKWLNLRNEALQVRGDRAEKGSPLSHLCGMDIATALHIFQGILNGVEYMHGMGVVHHDLKPSNIFVEGFEYVPLSSAEGTEGSWSGGHGALPTPGNGRPPLPLKRTQVRVGDFGLACHLAQPPTSLDDGLKASNNDEATALVVVPTDSIGGGGSCLVQRANSQPGDRKTEKEVIGTELYAAPEQLDGHCNLMSDTYSLAIILFELLHPFFTGMERGKVITALRTSGSVPDEFEHCHPNLASLINDMLSHNPACRPTIKKIHEELELILPGYENDGESVVKSDGLCLVDDDVTLCATGSRANDLAQTHECKESYTNVCQSFEESLFVENKGEGNQCGNFSCHAVRELQDITISKLKEENLKKDEIIEELMGRIRQLEGPHRNFNEVKENSSHSRILFD